MTNNFKSLQDIVITDTMAYDTNTVYVQFNKKVSYSADTTKDIIFDLIVEKNLKWGIELKQDFNKIDFRIGSEFTSTGLSSSMLYKASNGVRKSFGIVSDFDTSSNTGSIQVRNCCNTCILSLHANMKIATCKH